MIIAIPNFHTRVSPRFDCAQTAMVIAIENNAPNPNYTIQSIHFEKPDQRLQQLLSFDVAAVICGALDYRTIELFELAGITVYSGVIGEIEEALRYFMQREFTPNKIKEIEKNFRQHQRTREKNNDTKIEHYNFG